MNANESSMIPQFPEFKKLEIGDKAEIESFGESLPAYSDFDFVSLWSWDIHGELRISRLNDNLVVRFADYLTQEPFLSFFGVNKVNETAEEIFTYCKDNNLNCTMKLLPEEASLMLDQNRFKIQEDRDNFDYIYSTEEWMNFAGGDYARKRNEVHSLLNAYPDLQGLKLDCKDASVIEGMKNLYQKWIENKVNKGEDYEKNELLSFDRLLLLLETCDFLVSGLVLNGELVAFCISESSRSGYAVGHAAKADSQIKGTNAFVMKNLATILHANGSTFFNYEQDLGMENLRQAKERFRPIRFLKKYIVSQV